jgi:hypothetical protein
MPRCWMLGPCEWIHSDLQFWTVVGVRKTIGTDEAPREMHANLLILKPRGARVAVFYRRAYRFTYARYSVGSRGIW